MNREIIEKIILYDDGKHFDEEPNDTIFANAFKSRPRKGEYRVKVVIVKYEKEEYIE